MNRNQRQTRTLARLVASLATGLAASTAGAQHLIDIALGVVDNRIGSGVFQVRGGGEQIVPLLSQQVFITTFGTFPNFTDDPGFESFPGTFQPGSQIGFNIRKALRRWENGNFATIPPERMQMKLGPAVNTRLTPLVDEVVTGFSRGVDSSGTTPGRFHHHIGYTLLSPARNGVYLLEFELWSNQPGLGTSRPIWLLFGNNVPQSELEAAATWVRFNLWQPTCGGDLNADGVVDNTDFISFVEAYFTFACDPPGCPADFNGDFVVDAGDFAIFAQQYNDFLCP